MLHNDDYNALFSDDVKNESELRETGCSDSISALAVSSTAAVWCTMQKHLYVWSTKWTNPVKLSVTDFVVTHLFITPDNCIFVGDDMHIAKYCVKMDDELSIDGSGVDVERLFGYSYNFGNILHISASPDAELVSISTDTALVLVDGRSASAFHSCPLILLDCTEWYSDPGAAMTCCASSQRLFVLSKVNHLVSIFPDWISQTAQLERDGHVLTRAHVVTCLAASAIRDALLVVGLSDGTIKLLQMDTLNLFRSLDLTALLEKTIPSSSSSSPLFRGWKACKGKNARQRRLQLEAYSPDTGLEGASSGRFQSFVCDAAVGGQFIVVATPDAVMSINKDSFILEEERLFFFKDGTESDGKATEYDSESNKDFFDSTRITVCAPNGCFLTHDMVNRKVQHFVSAQPFPLSSMDGAASEENIVHAQQPLPEKWLTRLSIPGDDTKSSGKPVTFGKPIKSSGYMEMPWSEQQKFKQRSPRKGQQAVATEPSAVIYESYDQHKLKPLSGANRVLSSRGNPHRSAITSSVFSSNGQYLITGSSDFSIFALKYPVAKHGGEGVGLRGHTGTVVGLDVGLSLKTTLVLSCSTDGSMRVWKPECRETPYITHAVEKGREVRGAKLFYTDKFVSYAVGNIIQMCKFALDNGGGELDRKRNRSCFSDSLLTLYVDAQHITAMDCINHFPSSLVVAAGSNKSLTILDVVTQQAVQEIPNAHSRGIHRVAMCTNSRFSRNCSVATEHLFFTAGLDNAVNMWDLRQPRSIRQFALHKNCALTTLGLSFSPSGAFFAVGSEDRSVYLYDITTGGSALDIINCDDTPTSLAWHPTDPILAVGTASGSLNLYGQR